MPPKLSTNQPHDDAVALDEQRVAVVAAHLDHATLAGRGVEGRVAVAAAALAAERHDAVVLFGVAEAEEFELGCNF